MSPNPISLAIAVVLAGLGVLAIAFGRLIVPGVLLIALAVVVLASLKMAQQWEQAKGPVCLGSSRLSTASPQ